MQIKRILALSLLTAALAPAFAQVKIGVISSSTGPTSLVGIPQKNTVPLLPTKIGGLTVEYIARDDASDPTQTVTELKKMLSEQNIDALIGPTGSPNAMGVIQFMADAGVPMLAPVGTAAVVLPMNEQKKWVFKTTQNDDIIAKALVDHMVKNKVKTVDGHQFVCRARQFTSRALAFVFPQPCHRAQCRDSAGCALGTAGS